MAKAFGVAAMRALGTATGKSDSRTKMIKAVRAACRRLSISDEDRRAIQLEVTGQGSMGDMSLAELGQMLDHFNRDWKGPMGHRAHIGKIRALWWTLYWLGAIEDPKDAPLEAFIFRQTGKARINFLGPREAYKVIEALKSWAGRLGVTWPKDAGPDGDRAAVIDAIWEKLVDGGGFRAGGMAAYVAASLRIPADRAAWSRHELDAAIKLLGKRLRRKGSKTGDDSA